MGLKMTIPLIKESEEVSKQFHGLIESCHFCNKPTKYWHENTNNPVCEKCAPLHKVAELPDYGKKIRANKRKKAKEAAATMQAAWDF